MACDRRLRRAVELTHQDAVRSEQKRGTRGLDRATRGKPRANANARRLVLRRHPTPLIAQSDWNGRKQGLFRVPVLNFPHRPSPLEPTSGRPSAPHARIVHEALRVLPLLPVVPPIRSGALALECRSESWNGSPRRGASSSYALALPIFCLAAFRETERCASVVAAADALPAPRASQFPDEARSAAQPYDHPHRPRGVGAVHSGPSAREGGACERTLRGLYRRPK
jgi:hypothetical protein